MRWLHVALVLCMLLLTMPAQSLAAVENASSRQPSPGEPNEDCPTVEACRLWEEFKARYGDAFTLIEWDENRSCIKSIYGWYDTGRGEVKTGEDAELLARDFLIENTGIFKLDMSQLRLKDVTLDRRGMWTVDYAQYFHGVPVYRGEVRVLLTNKSVITDVFNDFHLDISIPTEPEISREEAVETVNAMTGENLTARETLKRASNTVLYILPKTKDNGIEYHLTWAVPTHISLYFIDATTKEILHEETAPAIYAEMPEPDYPHISGRALNWSKIILAALLFLAIILAVRRWRR